MKDTRHILFKPIKQSLALFKEEDAIEFLIDVIKSYPSVVAVDIIYTKDLHKMAGDHWVLPDDAPSRD